MTPPETTSRTRRLALLGASMGLLAAPMMAATLGMLSWALGSLYYAVNASGGADGPPSQAELFQIGISSIVELPLAGVVAGLLAGRLHATSRRDRRALLTSLGAAATWISVGTAISLRMAGDEIQASEFVQWAPDKIVGIVFVAAILSVVVWTPLIEGIRARRERGLLSQAWAGARQLVAFSVAFLGIVSATAAIPFTVVTVIGALMDDAPADAWTDAAGMLAASAITVGATVIGFRLSGVRVPQLPAPRRAQNAEG